MRFLPTLGLLSLTTLITAIAVKSQVNVPDVFQMPTLPPPPEDGRILSKSGLVVSTQAQATDAGIKILNSGGNAIDAAVAVGYALAVTDPCCGNLGGGGFMLIQPKDKPAIFINFREKAPLAADKDVYLKKSAQASRTGYLAVATPGTVMGLETALRQYGKLSRTQVIAPAIELAEKGFILSQGDAATFRVAKKRLQSAELFVKDDGQLYQAGDTLIQKELAESLKKIAQGGEKAFYQGEIAQNIIKASQASGGILSQADFTQYTVKQEKPLTCTYRGYEVITAPPPGGGLPLCQMLNILEGYPLGKTGAFTPQSLHWLLSAMFYGYQDRNRYLGDPDFVTIPQEKLLSKSYAAELRQRIGSYYAPRYSSNSPSPAVNGHTTHYSIVDAQGNAVSVTYTINSYFGAGLMAPGTGFLLNNEMDDFTTNPGSSNQFGLMQGAPNIIEPGKRPLSSMSPTIVRRNGRLFLVTGTPGGSTIITTILQVITNVVDHQLRVDQAVNSPRIHYQGEPRVVLSEKNGLPAATKSDLEARGYRFSDALATWGAAQTILLNSQGTLEGVNDYRRPGGAAIAQDQKSVTR